MAKSATDKNPADVMAKQLVLVLSDTYVLAVKTHGYHWNVMGPLFTQLHAFFGEQYEALLDAADELAERIRSLGLMPDGSMESFLQNTVIDEMEAKPLSAEAMLEDLLKSHQQIRDRLAAAANVADELGDVATEDLLIQRLQYHDKVMWMIRSQLV